MEAQENSLVIQRREADPDCLFEITQQQDPTMQREPAFFVKIVITKEIRACMNGIEKEKKDKVGKLQLKQKTPEMIALKQRCETFRKLDAKSYEEERRKNGGNNEVNKSIVEEENFKMYKQKYAFSLFDSFDNRGKCQHIKFNYSPGEKYLGIRINKNYFLNQLHLSRKDLFNVAISFTRTWQLDFHGMIRVLWRIYTDNEKPINYHLYIRSLDLISATFDVVFHDKRTYRFRYSPFEFRNTPTFKDDKQLTGYYQSLSCIPDITSSTKSIISDSEFYSNPRLFIFDDLTDNNLFYKILNRTNLVYQVYSIAKSGLNYQSSQGEPRQVDEFIKKCLGQFYFSTTRLKKILFTWSFRQFRRTVREKKPKEEEREPREVILHVSFQLERDHLPNIEPVYRMRMQLLQMTKVITYAIKDDMSFRLKEWYLLVKEILCQRDKTFFETQKINLNRQTTRDPIRLQFQDFQMTVQFNSRDRFDKFFIGLLLIVSTVLDRHYFTLHEDRDRKREQSKLVNLETQDIIYYSNKKQYIHYYHCFKLVFRHTYFPNMFYAYAKEEDKQGFFFYLQNSRNSDYKLKCGEWKLERVVKMKRKINIKNKEQAPQIPEQTELLSFPEDFKKYISILLKHFPLRIIYRDILSFVESIGKTCYTPQEENNQITLNGYDNVLRSIVNVLLNQYYYSQFKEKEEKLKEKEDKNSVNLTKEEKKPNEQSDSSKKEKTQDSFSRVLIMKILTRGDVGFNAEEKLLFEVTFKLMEFKSVWQTRIKEGHMVMRIFDDRMEFEKDFCIVHSLKGDMRNRKYSDETIIRSNIENCFFDSKATITL